MALSNQEMRKIKALIAKLSKRFTSREFLSDLEKLGNTRTKLDQESVRMLEECAELMDEKNRILEAVLNDMRKLNKRLKRRRRRQ